MEDHFSCADSFQATFGSCLPCLRPTHGSQSADSLTQQHDDPTGTRGVRRARSNELEGLLADAGDSDVDAISLHSNIGAGERRRRKKRGLKQISVFGWNLFGKPAIQLPDDGDDALTRGRRKGPDGAPQLGKAASTSTINSESDATALSHSELEHLRETSAQLDARAAAADAEDKRLKEQRRALRRERKELQKAARALALAAEGGHMVNQEGYEEGYGDYVGGDPNGYRHIPSPFLDQYASSPPPDPQSQSGLAAYFHGASDVATEPDSDDADLGGQFYARRTTSGNSNGSDSRSRTSASLSNPDHARYNHQYQSAQPSPRVAMHQDHLTSNSIDPPRRKKSKSSNSKSAKSQSSKHSSSTAQSFSLPSPGLIPHVFSNSPAIALPNSPLSLAPQEEEFEGFPGTNLGFPSPGIGKGKGRDKDRGAFLASRGDE